MPPAVAAAGIAAAGSLGSGILSSRASNKATDASSRANAAALQFERERDAKREAQYRQAQGMYQQQMAYRNALQSMLAERYGIKLPDWPPPGQDAGGGMGAPGMGGPGGGGPMRPGMPPQGNPLMGGPPRGGFTGGPMRGRPFQGASLADMMQG